MTMLFQLGSRPAVRAVDVGDLLTACHARIRRFLALAARLATTTTVSATEVRESAGQIRRYFAEALPLHIADEEELILPRLAGKSAAVDEALATMHADHEHHAELVARLIDRLDAPGPALAEAAAALHAAFEPHLALEERTIFPALAVLPAADLAAIKAEMRKRRESLMSQ